LKRSGLGGSKGSDRTPLQLNYFFKEPEMKDSKYIALALAVALAFALSASAAMAQSQGTVQLKGVVGANCTLSVSTLAKASMLDIVGGESQAHVATISESCNIGNGYKVTLASTNSGRLLSTAAGASPVSYTAAYDSALGPIANGLLAERDTAQFGKQGELYVQFSGNAQAIAGDYNDTITITVAAK
jgi:spore coat protein U-like protein